MDSPRLVPFRQLLLFALRLLLWVMNLSRAAVA